MDNEVKKEEKQLVPVHYGPSKAVVPLKQGESEVKSDAQVKRGTIHFLTNFSQLQADTDLKIPPSNWLRRSSKLEQHVRDLTWKVSREHEFSSIQMAHNSPELAGEVDVISNATNIKNLLKIPFEKSHISMMVHRVGKTLLLDEFDIHKHLLRQEQNQWEWLRQFYRDSVMRDLHETMKCVPRQSKSRDSLQNRNMYSKFLYKSLCDAEGQLLTKDVIETVGHQTNEKALIPDPLPSPKGPQFHRECLWTFEDIKMLIGTDLPVFCDDSYYVSLRLRDMQTPINVLTGLDYWLDNLMCNVPEVAMCFHIDGIVKKYEVIKTEDIPDLENSKFDPRKVTEIAKNILSFLKNNATKEGHTYWLYKGVNDDVVKLYDLTALCGNVKEPVDQNPFTVPLGMLLYRVARNMWVSQTPGKAALMRTLLETCLYLLDEEKHSQVCTSASYLLSDMFVPDSSLDDDWSLPGNNSADSSNDEDAQEWEEPEDEKTVSVDVDSLSDSGSVPRSKELVRLKPFTETSEERCQEAIKYIYKGLWCLDKDLSCPKTHNSSSIVEEQATCNSDEAIPLHYEPLHKQRDTRNDVSNSGLHSGKKHKDKNSNKSTSVSANYEKAIDSENLNLQMTAVSGEEDPRTWHNLSKGLLFKKATYAFTAITKQLIGKKDYLEAFKYLRPAFLCYDTMQTVLPQKRSTTNSLLSCLLSLAGDIRLFLVKLPESGDRMKDHSQEESFIIEMAEKELENFEYEWLLQTGFGSESGLQISVNCYRKALDLLSRKNKSTYESVAKRLGNALNELGVMFMHRSQSLLQTEEIVVKPSDEIQRLWVCGRAALIQGIEVFEEVGDVANQVLLHCNYGRLMRLCAQTHTHISLKGDEQEFSSTERFYFKEAIDHYNTALKLGEQGYKTVHDSVVWELCTTYFNMATLLQDYAPLSTVNKQEVEKEVITLMTKSLRYCQCEGSGVCQPMYQFRAATINHRLASLYHSSLRGECTDQRRRHLRQLSENHYEKALRQFQAMECHLECLRVGLEHLALLDFFLTMQTNSRGRQKLLLQMLRHLGDCHNFLKGFSQQLDDTDYQDTLHKEGETIATVIESRIQFVLLQLVKVFKSLHTKKSKDKLERVTEEIKSVYARSIQRDKDWEQATVMRRCIFLQTLLEEMCKLWQRASSLENDL